MRINPIVTNSYAIRFKGLKYENGEQTKEKINNENSQTSTFINMRKSEMEACKNVDMIVTDDGNIRLMPKTPRYLDDKYQRFYGDKNFEIEKCSDGSIEFYGNKQEINGYYATYYKDTFKINPVNNNGEYEVYKGHHDFYNHRIKWIKSDNEKILEFAKFLDGMTQTIDSAEKQYGMNCVDVLNRQDEIKEQQYREGIIEKVKDTYTFEDDELLSSMPTDYLNILMDNKYKTEECENFGIHISRHPYEKNWPKVQITDKYGYFDEKYNRFFKEENFSISKEDGYCRLQYINSEYPYYSFNSPNQDNNYNIYYDHHEGGSNLSSMGKEHFSKVVDLANMLDRVAKSAQRAEKEYGADYLHIMDEMDRLAEEKRIKKETDEEIAFREDAIEKVNKSYIFEDENLASEMPTDTLKVFVDNIPKIEDCENFKIHIDRDDFYKDWPVAKVTDEKGCLDEKYNRFYNEYGYDIFQDGDGKFIIEDINNREVNIELIMDKSGKYRMYDNDMDGGSNLSAVSRIHFEKFTNNVKLLNNIAQSVIDAEKKYGPDFIHILEEQDRIKEENYRKETIEKIKDTYIFDDEDLPQQIPTNYLTGLLYAKSRVDKLQHFGIGIEKNSYDNLLNVKLVDKDNCINPKYEKYYKKHGYTIINNYDHILVKNITTNDLYEFYSKGDNKYNVFYKNNYGECRLTSIEPKTIQSLTSFAQVMDNIAKDIKGTKSKEAKEIEANYTGKKYYDADGDFMTEEMFLDEIEPKVSALRFAKNNLSTADINNLSKLFEIEPDNVIHMSKKQYRDLCKTYHSDKKGNDRIFRILNNIYNAKN